MNPLDTRILNLIRSSKSYAYSSDEIAQAIEKEWADVALALLRLRDADYIKMRVSDRGDEIFIKGLADVNGLLTIGV